MMCRVKGCGAEGLFHETEGYCQRCYEEIEAFDMTYNNPDPTGYYERKLKIVAWFREIFSWIRNG